MAAPVLTAQSPSPGYISWTDFNIAYAGQGFPVAAGNTNKAYVWWEYQEGVGSLKTGDSLPTTLTDDDLLLFLNRGGIPVNAQKSAFIDGSLLINGTVAASALKTDQLVVGGNIGQFAQGYDPSTKAEQDDIAALVADSVVEYAVNASETVAPTTGWSTTAPTRTAGTYIWFRTTVHRQNGDTTTTDPALLTGNDGSQGVPGPPGEDGQTLFTWLKYADSPTSGMSDSPTGKTYIGLAYNKETPTESTNYADYMWSLIVGPQGDQGAPGPAGSDGQPTYTWIKYADSATGAGLSDSPTGKTYIGLAHNKTTAAESNTASDYTWALIQGPQGPEGSTGPQGVSVTAITRYWAYVNEGAAAPAKPTVATPPSPWVASEPAFTAGKDLYTTEKVSYSNGTFSYTAVVKSSSFAAANYARGAAVADMKNLWGHSTNTTLIDGSNLFTGSVYAQALRSDAIDGKTITGALFRTLASGQRMEFSSAANGGAGQMDFYTGRESVTTGAGLFTQSGRLYATTYNIGGLYQHGIYLAAAKPWAYYNGPNTSGRQLAQFQLINGEDSAANGGFSSVASLYADSIWLTAPFKGIEIDGNVKTNGPMQIVGRFDTTTVYAVNGIRCNNSGSGGGFTDGTYDGGGTTAANINNNGRVTRAGSLRSMKRDIEPMTMEQARSLLELQSTTGRWNDDLAMGDDLWPFFIADDVVETSHGDLWTTHNAAGEVTGVHYAEITVGLVALVRDLYSRIEALEAA